ncbi:helix-turn-helix transcriptional regulator [Blastomonas sp.]|uniref:helix-turn-helix domain-containing protein n=1 Tax=Blastomonas sp. TaxID=1909299 RepID=UPI00260C0FDC|nr:helix-turn-helix transcriptional regulator [Blastomonas sp.]MDM7957527.1 helix-turn-helix transcriptional regulator [Blastomonas sp.]
MIRQLYILPNTCRFPTQRKSDMSELKVNDSQTGWFGSVRGIFLEDWRAQLTEAQVNCLRLVAEGYTSKEIAKRLGLTPMTVDQYLHRAKTIVGAPDRRAAARRVFDPQSGRAFKPFELKTPAVAEQSKVMSLPGAPSEGPQDTAAASQWQARLGYPPLGGIRSDLDAPQKTMVILRIAGLSLIYILAFVLVLGGSLKVFS